MSSTVHIASPQPSSERVTWCGIRSTRAGLVIYPTLAAARDAADPGALCKLCLHQMQTDLLHERTAIVHDDAEEAKEFSRLVRQQTDELIQQLERALGGRKAEGDCRVLLIEDDPDLRDALAACLEHEGLTVATASDGAHALHLLTDGASLPAVILLDIMMPQMDGYEFRERQLADPRLASIPVVAMSAQPIPPDQLRDELAVDEAFSKPVNLERLVATIRDHCAQGRRPADPAAGDRGDG